ncbi:MAG TPA: hypothetical protein PLY90_01145 [Candidatus Hydrogenedentes bacterium]|jgi:uncharacterized membrane protein YesL|nr:hypothetical protein [Candidatus Hydrogenedentota bacterium]HOD95384.1 hypothetical protein [Candidatus Hydrogenedentota bacterium]HOM48337.1 hypothetical protein [Candidatus Hydrogenedentota bacterium]HOR50018.1 hypothetical protein [Candidatus Hydrogenedentota bacterium]HPK24360.1 hypothetical protein [Candidatus Hydrogenedentota bacterium]
MPKKQPDTSPVSLKVLFLKGFKEAHRRRPLSFYLLLLIPLVLLLGAHIFRRPVSLLHFAGIVLLLFLFFWIIMIRAVRDLFSLYKQMRAEQLRVYQETLGSAEFKASSNPADAAEVPSQQKSEE